MLEFDVEIFPCLSKNFDALFSNTFSCEIFMIENEQLLEGLGTVTRIGQSHCNKGLELGDDHQGSMHSREMAATNVIGGKASLRGIVYPELVCTRR